MRTPLLVANWKMNPVTLDQAERLFSILINELAQFSLKSYPEIIICPPFLYLTHLQSLVGASPFHSLVRLGSQDCSWEQKGAYTGEISPLMLKNQGVTATILGHSERRSFLKESDALINKKLKAALREDLSVILAVGEEKKEAEASDLLRTQLINAFKDISEEKVASLISIAYEPVWAISRGETKHESAAPDHVHQAMLLIRKTLKQLYSNKTAAGVRILYGGSTNAENISSFIKIDGIDGALVGSASLKPLVFAKMAKIITNSV